jgi:hypothetical protein
MPIRHVFCINTGRSGSDYLTGLFARARKAVSVHEGSPILNGRPMRQFNDGDERALRALLPAKLRAIRKHAKPGHVYCETNHSFIKGWGYLLPEAIPQDELGVVVLRRDPAKVAYSLLRLHDIPGQTEWGRTWYLSPGAKRNLNPPPASPTPYELCRWYVREVELRAEDYRRRFPGVTYFDCDLEELNDPATVRRMFAAFGLEPGPDLDRVIGKPLNTRSEWPKLSLEELTTPPVCPSADSLAAAERDRLIAEMVAYLNRTRGAELPADERMAGTRLLSATRLVAEAERELEREFGRALMFTDTEMILIHELLRSRHPRDVAFLIHRRNPPPGVSYSFEYNEMPSPSRLVRTLGALPALRFAWRAARGKLSSDPSHRGEA